MTNYMTLLALTSEPGAPPPSEVPYETDIQIPTDDALLVNQMVVTDSFGVSYTYTSSPSVALYGTYAASLTSLSATPNEGGDQAAFRVFTANQVDGSGNRQHVPRVDQITVNPIQTSSPGDFSALLPSSPGWAFESATCTVKRRPLSGNVIAINCFVERVQHQFDGVSWSTTLGLSNLTQMTTVTTGWLVLGNATTGKLGTGILGR